MKGFSARKLELRRLCSATLHNGGCHFVSRHLMYPQRRRDSRALKFSSVHVRPTRDRIFSVHDLPYYFKCSVCVLTLQNYRLKWILNWELSPFPLFLSSLPFLSPSFRGETESGTKRGQRLHKRTDLDDIFFRSIQATSSCWPA